MLPPSLVKDAVKADSVFVCFAVLSLRRRAQVIPVNANGVPIGEIPFVRSGLLGFVGPVSRTLSLEHFCGNLKPLVSLTNSITTLLLHHLLRTGQSHLRGGEDRRPADGERAETQRRRLGGHSSCSWAGQDCVPWQVRQNSSSWIKENNLRALWWVKCKSYL